MYRKFVTILRDESGAAAIEYGLVAALVSVAAIIALTALGVSLKTIFNIVAVELQGAAASAGGS